MNFIFFNVILLFAGFLAVLIFSIGFMACLAPMALLTKSKKPSYLVTFLLFGIVGIYQIYFWGLWSAFCVAMTIRFIHEPEVNWVWLYWISGFIWCTSLIGWLVHKETQLSQSTEEVRGMCAKRSHLLLSYWCCGFFSFRVCSVTHDTSLWLGHKATRIANTSCFGNYKWGQER